VKSKRNMETGQIGNVPPVLIGSSIPQGLEQVRLHKKLKQGDFILTTIPRHKEEALAVARYCRENKIYLCFSEFLFRGTYKLCFAFREHIPASQFYSKKDVDEIIDAAGQYYFGRIVTGEIGGVVYWPRHYTINRQARAWENLPAFNTMAEAKKAFVDYCKQWLDYERTNIGKGPLVSADASILQKYQALAGPDTMLLEVMPGDPHLMHAAIRGTAKAFGKKWGAHIAIGCYGGVHFDKLFQQRWRTALYYSYISGAEVIYPESGHYTLRKTAYHQKFGFYSKEMKSIRSILREMWQFARIHTRPASGPLVKVGVVHGNLDGTPGLWNRYVWGQFYDEKWLDGSAERGWNLVERFYRKEDWSKETVQGDCDFSGNPPFGQYDIVPVEAPPDILRNYSCLIFLAWNTMTPEIYEKLKDYVRKGGHLVMFLPQLSTHIGRAEDLNLYRKGDFTDLFGVRVRAKGGKDVIGIKYLANSSLKSYRFPLLHVGSDPRFIGNMTPSRVEMTTGRIIGYWDNSGIQDMEELKKQPMLIENSLGKGKAFLVLAWEYPGDKGLTRLTEDLLHTVLEGEQGNIRLIGSDRVRYAVYEGNLPRFKRKYNIIYILNTDPDCSASVRLWLRDRLTEEFIVGPGELRLAYCLNQVVVLPEDKYVDIKSWDFVHYRHSIEFYSLRNQKIRIHNLGKEKLTVLLNGVRCSCRPGESFELHLHKMVDPARKKFFAPDFLKEPAVKYKYVPLPY